jgi:hypothetical protein
MGTALLCLGDTPALRAVTICFFDDAGDTPAFALPSRGGVPTDSLPCRSSCLGGDVLAVSSFNWDKATSSDRLLARQSTLSNELERESGAWPDVSSIGLSGFGTFAPDPVSFRGSSNFAAIAVVSPFSRSARLSFFTFPSAASRNAFSSASRFSTAANFASSSLFFSRCGMCKKVEILAVRLIQYNGATRTYHEFHIRLEALTTTVRLGDFLSHLFE